VSNDGICAFYMYHFTVSVRLRDQIMAWLSVFFICCTCYTIFELMIVM